MLFWFCFWLKFEELMKEKERQYLKQFHCVDEKRKWINYTCKTNLIIVTFAQSFFLFQPHFFTNAWINACCRDVVPVVMRNQSPLGSKLWVISNWGRDWTFVFVFKWTNQQPHTCSNTRGSGLWRRIFRKINISF